MLLRTRSALPAALLVIALLRLPPAILYSAGRQPATVTVTVIDAGARYPLANADIIDLATNQHRFTDARGQTRLSWPTDAPLRLRVRQVGYQPLNRTLERAAVSDETTTFALSRVAYVISPVTATGHCVTTDDTVSLGLSVSVLDQLKQGAEKYDEFRRLYPFEATLERRTARVPETGPITYIVRENETFQSETWEPPYRPGNIVEYSSYASFNAPLLSLSMLADSVFWENHCFIARGIESYRGARAVRLEFSPITDLGGPDWMGAALLDSATSNLLRVEFHLANLDTRKGLRRLEGYQTFSSPSPFVIIPDSIGAVWWTRETSSDDPDLGRPDFAQSLHIESLKYRQAKPPENQRIRR
jgi:hypothetical protein